MSTKSTLSILSMLLSMIFLLSILPSCGHVEAHRDYYNSETARFTQQAEIQKAIENGKVAAFQASLVYAEKNPLVDLTMADGTKIRVNQPMPMYQVASGGGQPIQMTGAVGPRATPGEVVAGKFVDSLAPLGFAYFGADVLKTGFKAAANSTTSISGSYNQPGQNMAGGDLEIPTTTTTTTETITNSGIE